MKPAICDGPPDLGAGKKSAGAVRRDASSLAAPSSSAAWGQAAFLPVVLGMLVAVLGFASGCGRSDGPHRYALSGVVTYEGTLVPRGYITFKPDSTEGNTGPGTAAEIVNGHYATRAGQGTIGGAHKVTISGFDGQPFQQYGATNPMGRPLFEDYEIPVDVPKEASTRDFDLP